MNQLSHDLVAKTRKIEALILQRLAERKATTIAAKIGCNESTISRWKNDDLPKLAKIFAILGLKVVSEDAQVIDYEHRRALMLMARDYLEEQLAHNEKAHAVTWAVSPEHMREAPVTGDKDYIMYGLKQKSKQKKVGV